MPSDRSVSALRMRMLRRHSSPSTEQSPKVSPKAMSTWRPGPVSPLSHMIPRSVPETENRVPVRFGLRGPVTQATVRVGPEVSVGRGPCGVPAPGLLLPKPLLPGPEFPQGSA